MPIDYSRYPPTWKTEIRPRILLRAENKCEKCGRPNGSIVFAVKYRGKTKWFPTMEEAETQPKTIEGKVGRLIENPKPVKIVLTIAHLDHDESNWDVSDARLQAMCQKCHLTYDGVEKYLRRNGLKENQGI